MTTPVGTPLSAQGSSATASRAVTVPSATDLVAYICVFANGDTAINSMGTFGGVAPVLVYNYENVLNIYRVLNPAPGAATAQANLAASVFWSIAVQFFSTVDQADPDDAPVTNITVETASVTAAVTSDTEDYVLGFGLMVFPDISAFTGSTLSTSQPAIDGSVVSTAVVYRAGGPSVTVGVQSSDASFGDNRIVAINIRSSGGGGGGPTITAVDDDDSITSTQTGWDIDGSGFDTATVDIVQGAVTVAQDVNSQNATTINCDTVFDAGAGPHLKYGEGNCYVTNGDDSDDFILIEITAPSGVSYVDLTTPDSTAENRITAVPDLEAGDQLEISNVVGGTINDVVVNANATFNCDELVTSFDVRCWDHDDATWGAIGTQDVSGDLDPPIFAGEIPDINGTQNSAITPLDTGSYFTNASSYSLNQALPTGLDFDTGTGEISGTPTIAGTFDGFIVTGTNGGGSADSNVFAISIASDQEFSSGSGRKRDSRNRGFMTLMWGRG